MRPDEHERHAQRLEQMVRCLNIPLADDVAAMEAGITALRAAPALTTALTAALEIVEWWGDEHGFSDDPTSSTGKALALGRAALQQATRSTP